MKTIAKNNSKKNLSNDFIKNRKIEIRNKGMKKSHKIKKTLPKLTRSNLYVATDAGPSMNSFSAKLSQTV